MTSTLFLITLFCSIVSTLCLLTQGCYLSDDTCVLETFKTIHTKVVEGIQSLGLENLDTIYQEKVVGIVPKLNYTFTNAEFDGLQTCEVKDVKIDIDQAEFALNIFCPRAIISGHYELVGEVLSLPVEGNGLFSIISENVNFTFFAYCGKIMGEDGKEHYSITDFKQVVNSKSKVIYNFKNLYNGDQEKGDKLLKVANEQWKTLSPIVEGPGLFGFLKVYLSNINKYLESVPANQLFLT